MPARFPKPWSIEELGVCWLVRDGAGTPLAYFYWQAAEPVGTSVERPSKAQARVLAAAFARLGQ